MVKKRDKELGMEVLLFTTRLSIIACRHIVPYYYNAEPVKVLEIAEIYGFKPRSINPAFTTLVKAGILSSRVGGKYEERGFMYAKDPKEITLYDIVSALEGDSPVECCSDILKCKPAKCKDCSIHRELQKVIDGRKRILSKTTIFEQYERMKK